MSSTLPAHSSEFIARKITLRQMKEWSLVGAVHKKELTTMLKAIVVEIRHSPAIVKITKNNQRVIFSKRALIQPPLFMQPPTHFRFERKK